MLESIFRPEIISWLVPALLTIGAVLLGISALVGLCLLVSPAAYFQIAELANRWHPSDETMTALDHQFSWSRFFYRHHRAFGIALAVGSGYSLAQWALNYDRLEFLRVSNRRIISGGLEWLVASAEVIFVLLNAAAFIFAIIITLRPSVLKSVENWSDQWVRADSVSSRLDQEINVSDSFLRQRPRLAGALILAICLYIFAVLTQPTLILIQWMS